MFRLTTHVNVGNRTYDFSTVTAGQWTCILDLAIKWKFNAIHKTAIRGLQHAASALDPVEKIRLWQKYKITNYWVIDAFQDVCRREECLSLQEGRTIGVDNAVLIAEVRERLRKCTCQGAKPSLLEPAFRMLDPSYDIVKEVLSLRRPD
jgi:hypothetical protein